MGIHEPSGSSCQPGYSSVLSDAGVSVEDGCEMELLMIGAAEML